jgi:hypothetical protein
MSINVFVSINFTAESEAEANSVIAGWKLHEGAVISTSMNKLLDSSSGVVNDSGEIIAPEPPEPAPEPAPEPNQSSAT